MLDDLIFLTEVPFPLDNASLAQNYAIVVPGEFLVYPGLWFTCEEGAKSCVHSISTGTSNGSAYGAKEVRFFGRIS
jgi:hypothetical protein